VYSSSALATLGHRYLMVPLYFFVFATGATGLVYEVTWQRYLARLVGSDTMATAITIGTFLGGLSLGYYLCGQLSVRIRNYFRVYALLEAIIAIWCMLFPFLFDLFYSLTGSWSFAPPWVIIVQGVVASFLLTGIPTICMGATVPILTRAVSANVAESTGVHARLYGVNTAGAFFGTLLAGFWLIPVMGLPVAMLGTSFVNLMTAMFFYGASRLSPMSAAAGTPEATQTVVETASGPPDQRLPHVALYGIVLLSGFYVMTMENVLIRVANLSFGSSSYSV
jgi:spermidine synthase